MAIGGKGVHQCGVEDDGRTTRPSGAKIIPMNDRLPPCFLSVKVRYMVTRLPALLRPTTCRLFPIMCDFPVSI
jgi:hypothetical protein